jgi:hypothetical protein
MHTYRRRIIYVLNSLLIVFFLLFLFAYIQFRRGVGLLNIGLSYTIEDMIIIVLSFLSMLKVVYEIHNVEYHHEYEKRMRKTV